ncbi:hypothetical protein CCHR01_12441 [Colletotrichum chrysophilum]|uniref:Uncharacterized protein n=1 Tax=Colletotrichum chrysophilum TaxID=1836956 RepID=A0AAD9ADF2_9PEZI|nr:hypothetical protein CCHR01_12441 [Colletotrichum chrysophilum]
MPAMQHLANSPKKPQSRRWILSLSSRLAIPKFNANAARSCPGDRLQISSDDIPLALFPLLCFNNPPGEPPKPKSEYGKLLAWSLIPLRICFRQDEELLLRMLSPLMSNMSPCELRPSSPQPEMLLATTIVSSRTASNAFELVVMPGKQPMAVGHLGGCELSGQTTYDSSWRRAAKRRPRSPALRFCRRRKLVERSSLQLLRAIRLQYKVRSQMAKQLLPSTNRAVSQS